MGVPLYRWMVYFMENPIKVDDYSRGSPILRNLQILIEDVFGIATLAEFNDLEFVAKADSMLDDLSSVVDEAE